MSSQTDLKQNCRVLVSSLLVDLRGGQRTQADYTANVKAWQDSGVDIPPFVDPALGAILIWIRAHAEKHKEAPSLIAAQKHYTDAAKRGHDKQGCGQVLQGLPQPEFGGHFVEDVLCRVHLSALGVVHLMRSQDTIAIEEGGEIKWTKPGEKYSTIYVQANRDQLDRDKYEPMLAALRALPIASNGGAGASGGGQFVRASELVATYSRDLWSGYIPEHEVTILNGPANVGKSTIARNIVAALTSGGTLEGHDAPCEPCDVIYIATEESVEARAYPALISAGADPNRVHFYINKGGRFSDKEIGLLVKTIKETNAKLVVIDALKDIFLGVKDYEEVDVRARLGVLNKLAQTEQVTILGLAHWKKGSSSAIERLSGSHAWIDVVRGAIIVAEHEDTKYFASQKHPDEKGVTRQFLILPGAEVDCGGKTRSFGVAKWCEERPDITAQFLATAQAKAGNGEDAKTCAEWLEGFLEKNGPTAQYDVKDAAQDAGYSWPTIERAKKKLGHDRVRSEKRGKVWIWSIKPVDAYAGEPRPTSDDLLACLDAADPPPKSPFEELGL